MNIYCQKVANLKVTYENNTMLTVSGVSGDIIDNVTDPTLSLTNDALVPKYTITVTNPDAPQGANSAIWTTSGTVEPDPTPTLSPHLQRPNISAIKKVVGEVLPLQLSATTLQIAAKYI